MAESFDIDAAFAALREVYAKTLPGEIAELATIVERALGALSDAALVAEARHVSHRIAGTAASYEFEEISRCARTLETFFLQIIKGAPVPEDAAPTLRECLQELKKLSAPFGAADTSHT